MGRQIKLRKRTATNQPNSWTLAFAFFIITLAAVSIVVWNKASINDSYPPEMTAREVLTERGSGAFVVDVREPNEWAEYHLSNSVLIPLGELKSRLNEIPRNKKIIVVCRSGNRSASGRDILLEAGYTAVTSLKGGLTAWRGQGYPTES